MSIRFYDDAITDKFKHWVKDPHMTVTSPSETARLFEYYADVTDDKPISLPLIAIRRMPTLQIQARNKKPMSFDGKDFTDHDKSTLKNKTIQLSAIPMDLEYQLDIYTRYFTEADEYMRNFVFNIVNYPTLEIELPYNSIPIKMKSFLILHDEIEDNSDIPERLMIGQFTRLTIRFRVDHAYLYSTEIVDNSALGVDMLYVIDHQGEHIEHV